MFLLISLRYGWKITAQSVHCLYFNYTENISVADPDPALEKSADPDPAHEKSVESGSVP